MKNMLKICQEAASLACVQPPQSLLGTDSQNEQIFLSIAQDALNGLLRYGDWQELTRDGELVTREGQSDYPIADFCPDFFQLLNNTVYIKDKNEKVIGSVRPEQWQKSKYLYDSNSQTKFKIQNSMFRFLIPPQEGLKIVFQYRSSAVVFAGDTLVEKSEITADSDIPVFDEYLVKLAVRWRLQARNGLAYQEEFNEYEKECRRKFGASSASHDIHLGSNPYRIYREDIAYVKQSN